MFTIFFTENISNKYIGWVKIIQRKKGFAIEPKLWFGTNWVPLGYQGFHVDGEIESKVKRLGFALLLYLFFTQKLIYLNKTLFEEKFPALYKSERQKIALMWLMVSDLRLMPSAAPDHRQQTSVDSKPSRGPLSPLLHQVQSLFTTSWFCFHCFYSFLLFLCITSSSNRVGSLQLTIFLPFGCSLAINECTISE